MIKEVNNDNIIVGTGKGILKILKISYQDECELNKERIKVQFDNFTYVTSLNIVEENE